MNRLVSTLFFLSGATGLLYEVLWTKHLTLALGSTALAQTFVLSAFLGGLALGYAWFGAKADRSPSPLRLYGKLELGIAALAVISPLVFRWVELLPSGLRPALAAAFILAPAALMGGTLPALCRWAVDDPARLRRGLSWFYFLNNAGAVLGTVAAGFVLIPTLGLDAPIWLAAGLNLTIGAAVLTLSGGKPPEPGNVPAAAAAGTEGVSRQGAAGWNAAAFLCGFVSLCYEIGWIRLAGLSLGASTYSFALMLAAFIAGLAAGTLVLARGAFAEEDSATLFAWTQFGVAGSILLSWPLYERLPFIVLVLNHQLPRSLPAFYGTSALLFSACWLLMLAPAAFLGAALPLASRAALRGGEGVGSGVGRMFAANTAGNVAGAFAAGLWLLPALGLQRLFQLGMAVNAAVGLAVLLSRRGSGGRRRALPAAAALLLGAVLASFMHLDRRVLASGTFRMEDPGRLSYREFKDSVHRAKLLLDRDDPEFTVSVTEDPDGVRYLKSNGKTEASSGEDMATQALLAHLPLTLHPRAREALLVGLGSGVTAGAALRHPLERLDVVEIARGVAEAEPAFRPMNGAPLADPRTALHIADAKTFLRESRRGYDVIISEPSNPWVSGVGGLFSAEFYHVARSRLRPGGLMVQWFHLYEMSDDILRLVLRTFCSEFPHATLWDVGSNDILLVGSAAPPEPPFALMEAAAALPPVQEDLARFGLGRLTTLLSLQAGSDAAVRRAAGAGPLNRDHSPLLEYRAPLALYLDGVSGLVQELDERRPPANGRGLVLAEYMPRRGRPFSKEELLELIRFHGRYGGPVFEALRADWNRRFPREAIRPRDIMKEPHPGG